VRVCLNTNVLIAAFATRGLCADVLRTVLAEHELVIGEVMLAELRRVLTSKFKLPVDRLATIEAVFAPFPIIPRPAGPSDVPVRDPAARWTLDTALDGEADVLVTGDADLLAAAGELPLRIVDPRAFWELLRDTLTD